jgi:hypothetical protein
MRCTRFILAALIVGAPVTAQSVDPWGPEIRPFIGAFIPTASQVDDFKAATMLGTQAAFELSENFHLLGSFAWTHGHNKFTGFSKDLTYIWQYDVGAELNLMNQMSEAWLFRPFAGLGVGGRTYDYKAVGIGAKTCTAGYGALGTEFQSGAIAVRFEARDYVSCFESPITGRKQTRNDLGLSLGFAYHFR